MQEELTEYEKQKAQKKRELVRKELQTVEKYQILLIKKRSVLSFLSNKNLRETSVSLVFL